MQRQLERLLAGVSWVHGSLLGPSLSTRTFFVGHDRALVQSDGQIETAQEKACLLGVLKGGPRPVWDSDFECRYFRTSSFEKSVSVKIPIHKMGPPITLEKGSHACIQAVD